MNRKYSINGSRLIAVFILYSMISMVLFLLTAGGWFGGLGAVFNVLFYTGCFLILVVKVARASGRAQDTLVLPVWLLTSIVAVQVFVYLFNFGDCGDGPGSVLFLQRLFIGKSSGEACRDTQAWFSLPVLLGHLTYYILTFSLIMTSRGTQERTSAQP
jgi:hypothetical protein